MEHGTGEHQPASTLTLIGYLFIGFSMVAGMASALSVLIYEGLNVSLGNSAVDYDNAADLMGHASPAIVLSVLMTAVLFVWIYLRYGETIKRNL